MAVDWVCWLRCCGGLWRWRRLLLIHLLRNLPVRCFQTPVCFRQLLVCFFQCLLICCLTLADQRFHCRVERCRCAGRRFGGDNDRISDCVGGNRSDWRAALRNLSGKCTDQNENERS